MAGSDKEVPENNDPIIEEQVEQTFSRHHDDIESIKFHMQKEYDSPESAIDDYRRGYISDEFLAIRFTPDEVDFIHEESKERDEAAKPQPGEFI